MIRNYLKMAFRSLWKYKGYATINILGLALGLSCALLIGLWIHRELTMNQFHEKVDRIYRLLENQDYSDGYVLTTAATPGPLAAALRQEIPEFEKVARITWGDEILMSVGEKSFKEEGYNVDEDFLNIFSYPLIHGTIKGCLSAPGQIVITEETATKYFGTTDVVGKAIRVNDEKDYSISGVLKNIPESSMLQFNYLLPMGEYEKANDWLQSWNNNGILAYVLLREGADVNAVNAKIKDFVNKNSEQENVALFQQSLTDQYLRTDFENGVYQGGGRIAYVRLFALIAVFIILIACINFMNLSTARSARRAREVGIRRVSGAVRGQLIGQFLGESLFLSFLAGIIALGIAKIALPAFNELYEAKMAIGFHQPELLGAWLAIILITGLLAGSYPALFLSSFEPVKVLKGLVKTGKGSLWFRQGLVITQFAIATFLIVGTLVVYNQMTYLQNKSLGYHKENLLFVPVTGTLWDKYDVVKAELLKVGGVQSVSSSNGQIFSWGNNTSGVKWEGKQPDQSILFQTIPTGLDFLATIGAELKAGRDFSKEYPADTANYIINERAAELMGIKDPVGQWLDINGERGTIVGLAKNFYVNSFHSQIEPVIMMLRPWKNLIYLRIDGSQTQETLSGIEQVLKRNNPAYPFEYSFVDEEYNQLYRSEQRVGVLSKVFAFLAIFISCLGLFGLAAFSAERRIKEIGIRKVLGASVQGIVGLLSKDFLMLVLAATIIGIPFAWWMMHRWLERFAYHINLGWWVFGLAGVLAVAIAFFTVGFQALRAAVANPVKSLRSE